MYNRILYIFWTQYMKSFKWNNLLSWYQNLHAHLHAPEHSSSSLLHIFFFFLQFFFQSAINGCSSWKSRTGVSCYQYQTSYSHHPWQRRTQLQHMAWVVHDSLLKLWRLRPSRWYTSPCWCCWRCWRCMAETRRRGQALDLRPNLCSRALSKLGGRLVRSGSGLKTSFVITKRQGLSNLTIIFKKKRWVIARYKTTAKNWRP